MLVSKANAEENWMHSNAASHKCVLLVTYCSQCWSKPSMVKFSNGFPFKIFLLLKPWFGCDNLSRWKRTTNWMVNSHSKTDRIFLSGWLRKMRFLREKRQSDLATNRHFHRSWDAHLFSEVPMGCPAGRCVFKMNKKLSFFTVNNHNLWIPSSHLGCRHGVD